MWLVQELISACLVPFWKQPALDLFWWAIKEKPWWLVRALGLVGKLTYFLPVVKVESLSAWSNTSTFTSWRWWSELWCPLRLADKAFPNLKLAALWKDWSNDCQYHRHQNYCFHSRTSLFGEVCSDCLSPALISVVCPKVTETKHCPKKLHVSSTVLRAAPYAQKCPRKINLHIYLHIP